MNQPLIARYLPFLELVLTPNRLKHSLGVMQVMEELAAVYSLDRNKAVTAALLHDAAKDLPAAQQWRLIEEAGLVSNASEEDGEMGYGLYFHGPVGAYFVQKELGITDTLILDAICMHSFCGEGANFHSPFVWCLQFADLLEPNRRLSDARWSLEVEWYAAVRARYQKAVNSGMIIEAAYLHTDWIIKMFEEKGFPIHPNMRRTHRELSLQLKQDGQPLPV